MKGKTYLVVAGFVATSISFSWLFSAMKPLVLPLGSETLLTIVALLPDITFWLGCSFFWGFKDFGLSLRQQNSRTLGWFLCFTVLPFYTILISLIFVFDTSYSNLSFPSIGRTIDIFVSRFFAILIVPVLWEEVTFHGILQGYLQRTLTSPTLEQTEKQIFFLDWPVIVTSFAFSLSHLSLLLNGELDRDYLTLFFQILLFYPVLGFILGKVRRISGSVVIPILVHTTYNTLVNIPNYIR